MISLTSNLVGGYDVVPMWTRGEGDKAVGERITHLWKSLNYPSSASFARFLGVTATRLNNVENGSPLARDLAMILRQKVPGLTTEWLWFGDPARLPYDLVQALEGKSGRTKRKKRS